MPKVRVALTKALATLRVLGATTADRARRLGSPVVRRVGPLLTSRWTRLGLVAVIGLGAGYLGLVGGGRYVTPVGPTDVQLTLRPSLHGGTTLKLPPLGSLRQALLPPSSARVPPSPPAARALLPPSF